VCVSVCVGGCVCACVCACACVRLCVRVRALTIVRISVSACLWVRGCMGHSHIGVPRRRSSFLFSKGAGCLGWQEQGACQPTCLPPLRAPTPGISLFSWAQNKRSNAASDKTNSKSRMHRSAMVVGHFNVNMSIDTVGRKRRRGRRRRRGGGTWCTWIAGRVRR